MSTQTIDTQMPELPQAARLHLARYLAGMEMQELSRVTGISRGTIANYERLDYAKRRTPAYIKLWALATGVPLEWLMSGDAPRGGGLPAPLDRRDGRADDFGRILPFPSAEGRSHDRGMAA